MSLVASTRANDLIDTVIDESDLLQEWVPGFKLVDQVLSDS